MKKLPCCSTLSCIPPGPFEAANSCRASVLVTLGQPKLGLPCFKAWGHSGCCHIVRSLYNSCRCRFVCKHHLAALCEAKLTPDTLAWVTYQYVMLAGESMASSDAWTIHPTAEGLEVRPR